MQKLNDPKIKGSERKRKLAFCLIVQFQFVQTQSPLSFHALKHSLSLFENVFLMIVKYFLIMIFSSFIELFYKYQCCNQTKVSNSQLE